MSAIGRRLVSVVFAGAVVGAAITFAQSNLATLSSITSPEIRFVPDPERPGAASAVLVGDPSKAGVYVMHRRIPANIRIQPHSHSELWRIGTVLSGTLYYGYGDTFDESKLKALGPGSVVVEPKDQPHFAMTKDEAVTVQIVAEGPTATNPVRK
jgi:quercetin dioxygenase-like cupin family protein